MLLERFLLYSVFYFFELADVSVKRMSGLDLALSMSSNPLVFIVDADADQRHRLAVMLESHRHAICAFASGRQFLDRLHPMQAGCGLELGDMHGLGVLQALRDEGHTLPVIVLDGGADKATIIQLMKLGVDEVLQVPTVADDQVLSAVHHALETDAKNRMQRSEACALSQRFASLCPREQEFRNLSESSPDSIMRYDREGRILYLNQKLSRDLGVTAAELIGKTPCEVWPDDRFADIAQAVMRAIGSGEATTVELGHPLATGESIFSQVRVVAERDAAGRIVGALAFGRDITAIREAERKLRHFVDSLPGMAHIFRLSPDGHGCFPFVSSGIEEIYGLRPEDVKDDMAPLHHLAHPEDRPRIEAALAESARTMAPLRIEFRVCRPGQPERWIEVRAVPERYADGDILWYGIMLDITERKMLDMKLAERTEQLHDEHNFINAVLDTQAALVLVMDAEGRVVQFNRAYETATGYDFEALQDCNACWELVPDEKREAVQQVIATLQAGATLVEHESQLLCRDGSKRLIFWRNTTLRDKAGRLRYIIKTGIDVTDQRRVEEEAHERLEEASRLQRLHTANELATVLAHELNQPLAAIAMNAKAVQNLLQDQNGPPDLGLIRETVQRVQQQSVRAGESIRQLRAFVSRGKLDPHPIDLNGVLLDACGLIRAKMKARNIRLQFELDASLPPVMGVEVHVEQVLLNLLRNGIEAIDEASMHDGTVTVTSSLVQNMAQVSVCDTGPGIDANLAARLFGQLESTKVDGLGVGLRISRSLIEAQEGGRLWVEAHSPGGVFHFVLPLVKIAS